MRNIDIVLTEGFQMLSLTLVTEPLRVANRESLAQIFRWRFLSASGQPVMSSGGISLPTDPVDKAKRDAAILLCSYHPEAALTAGVLNWLKECDRAGCLMGCVDTGALVFAEAGLLSRHPAAAHFEALPGYVERYSAEMFVDRLFDFSPPRFSSAGGVATFDMTLALIEHFSDPRLAARVAEILTYIPAEHPGAQERLSHQHSLAHVDRTLAQAVGIMMATLQDPLAVSQIAARVNLPDWKLTQLFKRYMHSSPGRYYLRLRLQRARHLLRNSHHAAGVIGIYCGFDNQETFSRAYRRAFGIPPSQDRRPRH